MGTITFQKRGKEWRRCWGYEFEWTSDHMTPEELHPLIYEYDELGSKALDRLDEISPPPPLPSRSKENGEPGPGPPEPEGAAEAPRRDLYQILRDNADKDDVLGQLWAEVTTVPDWVDWEQIERGQEVFYRYAGPIIIAVRRPASPSQNAR